MAETRPPMPFNVEGHGAKGFRTHGLLAKAAGLNLSKAQQEDVDNNVPVPEDQQAKLDELIRSKAALEAAHQPEPGPIVDAPAAEAPAEAHESAPEPPAEAEHTEEATGD